MTLAASESLLVTKIKQPWGETDPVNADKRERMSQGKSNTSHVSSPFELAMRDNTCPHCLSQFDTRFMFWFCFASPQLLSGPGGLERVVDWHRVIDVPSRHIETLSLEARGKKPKIVWRGV